MKPIVDLHYAAYDHYELPWKLVMRTLVDYELFVVTSGQGAVWINSKEYLFSKGDVLVIPPGEPYSMRSVTLPLEFACAHFDLYGLDIGEPLVMYNSYNDGKTAIRSLSFTKPGKQKLYKFNYQVPIFTVPKPGSRLSVESRQLAKSISSMKKESLDEIVLQIAGLAQLLTPENKPEFLPPKAAAILEYIEKNYSQTITLEQIADHVNLTPIYISQMFKKAMGMPLTKYLRLYRIAVAKSLLRNTNQNLDTIAVQTGFYDTSHFCRCFHAEEGMSPTKYRNGL